MTRLREGYKNYFLSVFFSFSQNICNFFLCKSVLYKNFFVYLQSEIFKYHENKI